jgi:hypothetical protein
MCHDISVLLLNVQVTFNSNYLSITAAAVYLTYDDLYIYLFKLSLKVMCHDISVLLLNVQVILYCNLFSLHTVLVFVTF